MTQSVDNIVVATEAALVKALFVTSRGSIIPALTISTVFPVTTSNPSPCFVGVLYSFTPAFSKINSKGLRIAQYRTSSPMDLGSKAKDAFNNAIPPPGTIPSFIAAFVAQIASSTLSLFSFNSTSELAPTFTTATLAFSLASLFSSLIIKLGFLVFLI